MKIAIVYYSSHHGNTKRLLDAVCAENHDIVLINAAASPITELSDYDLIGFASGIYYSKFHDTVLRFAEQTLKKGQKVFFLYTCGIKNPRYTAAIQSAAEKKGAVIAGSYGCRGFDTFGPWKLIGGIAKGHPDQSDIAGAVKFLQSMP